jgi:hypothetical protein
MKPVQTPDIRINSSDRVRLNRNLRERIRQSGYAIVEGKDFFIPVSLQQHWQDFANSWNHLSEDVYLQHAGFKRLRRYSYILYDLFTREMTLLPNAPFYQSKLVNPLVWWNRTAICAATAGQSSKSIPETVDSSRSGTISD